MEKIKSVYKAVRALNKCSKYCKFDYDRIRNRVTSDFGMYEIIILSDVNAHFVVFEQQASKIYNHREHYLMWQYELNS
jgi:hypothetical protein